MKKIELKRGELGKSKWSGVKDQKHKIQEQKRGLGGKKEKC